MNKTRTILPPVDEIDKLSMPKLKELVLKYSIYIRLREMRLKDMDTSPEKTKLIYSVWREAIYYEELYNRYSRLVEEKNKKRDERFFNYVMTGYTAVITRLYRFNQKKLSNMYNQALDENNKEQGDRLISYADAGRVDIIMRLYRFNLAKLKHISTSTKIQ